MISGKVSEIEARDWKNGIKMHHFRLEGSPTVHNCGTTDPQILIGEAIRFTEQNRKVNVQSIERIAHDDVARPATVSHPVRSAPDTDIGVRIRRQEARRDAIRLVTMAMQTDLLPYPKSGKAIDKWDRMLDLVNETTNDLLEQESEWTNRSTA